METSIANASLAMNRATMGQEASLMMIKQAATQGQAVVQMVAQAVQAAQPPQPTAPHLGQNINITA